MIAKGSTGLKQLIQEIAAPNFENYLIICSNPKETYRNVLADIIELKNDSYAITLDPEQDIIIYGYMFFIFRKPTALKSTFETSEIGLDLCLFENDEVIRSKEFNQIVRPLLGKRFGKAYQYIKHEITKKDSPPKRQKRNGTPKGRNKGT